MNNAAINIAAHAVERIDLLAKRPIVALLLLLFLIMVIIKKKI